MKKATKSAPDATFDFKFTLADQDGVVTTDTQLIRIPLQISFSRLADGLLAQLTPKIMEMVDCKLIEEQKLRTVKNEVSDLAIIDMPQKLTKQPSDYQDSNVLKTGKKIAVPHKLKEVKDGALLADFKALIEERTKRKGPSGNK